MRQPFKILVAALVVGVLPHVAVAQYSGAKAVPANLKPGFDAVSFDDSKRILTFLATNCEGRGTGQPGFEKAARFVANEFRRIGLKPLGDDGTYFQRADVTAAHDMHVEFRGPDGVRLFSSSDFIFTLNGGVKFGGSIAGSGLPLFIDYEGSPGALPSKEDLHGRIVFFHCPSALFDDPTDDPILDNFFDKLTAEQPTAFFGVQDDFKAFKTSPAYTLFHGPHWSLNHEPNATIDSSITNITVRALLSVEKLAEVGKIAFAARGTSSLALGKAPISFAIKGDIDKKSTENVVGLLEGSDPTLKSEYVVVGGHLDHFGIQDGVVYPGADDDGSGAADVIEIAKAMAANPMKPRRSIIFITWFGEEQGLLGSTFFVNHPPVPLDKIVAELQMDMVARDADGPQQDTPDETPNLNHVEKAADNFDTIRVVGSKRISTEMDKDVRDANAYVNFRIIDDSEYLFGRSDDASFVSKGIPTAFLFDGFHPDYHQATDTVDKIDWVKLANSAKLFYLAAHAVADADSRPVKDVASGASK